MRVGGRRACRFRPVIPTLLIGRLTGVSQIVFARACSDAARDCRPDKPNDRRPLSWIGQRSRANKTYAVQATPLATQSRGYADPRQDPPWQQRRGRARIGSTLARLRRAPARSCARPRRLAIEHRCARAPMRTRSCRSRRLRSQQARVSYSRSRKAGEPTGSRLANGSP